MNNLYLLLKTYEAYKYTDWQNSWVSVVATGFNP